MKCFELIISLVVTFFLPIFGDQERVRNTLFGNNDHRATIDEAANRIYHDIEKRLNGYDYDRSLNSPYESSMCDFKVNDALIIKTTESTEAGAQFLTFVPSLLTKEECQIKCCLTDQCNLAVFKESVKNGEEHACYLFDCLIPSVCTFSNHTGYVSMMLEGVKLTKDQEVKHENDLELLAVKTTSLAPTTTTTTQSTTSTTTTIAPTPEHRVPVALFGDCHEHRDCAGAGTECLAGYCVCQDDYHAQDGLCRKDCSRFEFECVNAGIPLAEPQCVAIYDKCDGTAQCQDGSDEQHCDNINSRQRNNNQDSASGIPLQVNPNQSKNSPGISYGGREQGSRGQSNQPLVPAVNGNGQQVVAQPVEPVTPQPIPMVTEKVDNVKAVQSKPSNSDELKSKPPAAVDSFLTPTKQLNDTKSGVVHVDIAEQQVHLSLAVRRKEESTNSVKFSSRGAVIALGLGLSVTALLLLFVGCRLRTVKTRLRRGRPLTTGEADYLINGMYL